MNFHLFVDFTAELEGYVAGAISESVVLLGVFGFGSHDVVDDSDLVGPQLNDLLSGREALAAASVHLKRAFFETELTQLLDDVVVLDLVNLSLHEHPDRVILELGVRVVDNLAPVSADHESPA
jgi:hypothetical protein